MGYPHSEAAKKTPHGWDVPYTEAVPTYIQPCAPMMGCTPMCPYIETVLTYI